MASPIPNQQPHPFSEFQAQPPLQPVSPVPGQDARYSQNYMQSPVSAFPHSVAPPPIFVQPSSGAQFVAELPAALPPAPPTSTPAQQLNEDEILAHKLQQMEVAGVRARSSSDLSRGNSQYSPNSSMSAGTRTNPHYPNGPTYKQSTITTRPHSYGVSSQYGQNHYTIASQTQLSPRTSREDVAPEVVVNTSPPIPCYPNSLPPPYSQQPKIQPTIQPPPASPDPSSLSAYLEQHRQVPYPPQWVLPPVTKTLYGSFLHTPKTDWLDQLDSQLWSSVRFSEAAKHPTPSAFRLSFKSKGGSFRDPRFHWSMTSFSKTGKLQNEKQNWNYNLRTDLQTGIRVEENLRTPKGQSILCTYIHAANYDCLRFIGLDGRTYKWVSHAPVSMLKGHRYDTTRHALFVSTSNYGNQDPLYGQIIADHCFWDGYVDYNEVHEGTLCKGCGVENIVGLRWKCKGCPDHDICDTCRQSNRSVNAECEFTLVSLPDEALNVRSKTADVGMIVATLQVLLDWEKVTLREERRKDSAGFAASVENARKYDLGRMSFWRTSDFEGTGVDESVHGTLVKAKSQIRRQNHLKHGAHAAELIGAGGELVGAGINAGFAGDGGGGGGGGGDGGGGGGGAC